uniref:DNA topoisomerase 2 n=1 Tax=Noctiluca scintillans TaxID=2966 RepID=A0A7S1AKX6_NOCSC
MTALEPDIVALMERRAYDVAAATHGRCRVTLNSEELSVHSFEDYVKLFLGDTAWRVCEVVNDRWEVAVGLTDGGGFQQMSFVNAISTSRGGSHVNYITDQVVNAVIEKVSKQKTGSSLSVKPPHVKGYLWIFVNCLIENPAFDSQTKDTLTSKRERFGSTCVLPEAFVTSVVDSGIVDMLLEWSKAFGKSELAQHLNRSDFGLQKRLFGIPKLEDANKAGTKDSSQCTLILTEGDSAKSLVIAGMSVIGRERFGVFPLRGKLRNVRDLTTKQMLENKEIDQMMKILALDSSKQYDTPNGLRYGSVMIMTDQDHDGSHIKGLIINFLHTHFPSLIRMPGFLKEFVTPIVKVTRGEESLSFYTLPEYEVWAEANNGGHGWTSKYYKGLGTSTGKEAKEYFSDLENHEIEFRYTGEEEDGLIDMAFNRERADERKKWIAGCQEGEFVDHSQSSLSYTDFVNKELVLFAKYDVERMIPSVVDGLKPGQRKVLFGVFKRKLVNDMKVASLAGYVAEHSSYHHGETSLQGTIVAMAQTFVGSNNINLLVPSGQFGSRLKGGKDHAACRYIFTRLSKVTRCLFPEDDDKLLEYLEDEGLSIEPQWYCPVIPLVLANGAEGIAVGWATSVPNYSPRELIANVRRLIRGEKLETMLPWYRGYKGTISAVPGTTTKFETCGVAVRRGQTRLEITELPVKKWTQDYKEWLLEQLPSGGTIERKALITDLREHHAENSVHFVATMTPDKLLDAERRGLEKVFHLRGTMSTSNMMLFDRNGKIRKYQTVEDIFMEHALVRLRLYEKRKAFLIDKLERELAVITNRYRFVKLIVTGGIDPEGLRAKELCRQMRKHRLQTMGEIDGRGDPAKTGGDETGAQGFQYLLSMKLWSLTEERLEMLRKQHDDKTVVVDALKKKSLEELWEDDLVNLEAALDQMDRDEQKDAEKTAKLVRKTAGETDNGLTNKQCLLVLSQHKFAKRVRTSEWKVKSKLGGRMALNKTLLDKKTTKKEAEGDDKKMKKDVEAEGEAGEEDVDTSEPGNEVTGAFCCHDFDALLVFSDHGFAYMIQALDVPLAKRLNSPGALLSNFIPELGEHRIAAVVTLPQVALKEQNKEFVMLVTEQGMAKKVGIDKFRALMRLKPGCGITAMRLDPDDKLKWALRVTERCALVIATLNGKVLRVSLGSTWKPSAVKGPGRHIVRPRFEGDRPACCAVAAMNDEEAASLIKHPVQAPDAERPDTVMPDVEDAGNTAPSAPSLPVRLDDDSDDEGQPPAPVPPVNEVKLDESEIARAVDLGTGEGADDDQDGNDVEENESAEGESDGEQPGGPVAGNVTEAPSDVGDGQAILLITANGYGLRMPLSNKRLPLKRGCAAPKSVMRLHAVDEIVGACVVSCKEMARPADPKKPWYYYYEAHKQEFEHEPNSGSTACGSASVGDSAASKPDIAEGGVATLRPEETASMGSFSMMLMAKERFHQLPESDREPYCKLAEEAAAEHTRSMEEYKDHSMEEMLLASKLGSIVRLQVVTVPVVHRVARGKILAKLKGDDTVCTASLLSAFDDDPDEVAEKQDDKPRGTQVPDRPRTLRRKAPTPAVASGGPAEKISRTPSRVAQGESVPRRTPARSPLLSSHNLLSVRKSISKAKIRLSVAGRSASNLSS